MNTDKLQSVNINNTSRIIFNLLAGSKPVSNETNVESFKIFLKKRGFAITDDEFYRAFDELEETGAGYYSSVRPTVFVWNYNLRDISEKIMNPARKIELRAETIHPEPVKTELKLVQKEETVSKRIIVPTPKPTPTAQPAPARGRGRPPGAKNKPKVARKPAPARVLSSRPAKPSERPAPVPGDFVARPEVLRELVLCFTTKKGKMLTLSMEDADALIKQVQQVRSELGA